MSQSGYTQLQLYRSATATNVPLAAALADGELAINTADGRLFYKDNSGTVQTIASSSTVANAVLTTGNQTIGGTKTFSSTISGSINGNAATATNVAYSGLTGTVPTWNQNTTGTAASISGFNNPTTAATANTIAYRDANGYLYAVYLNQSSPNTENPGVGQVMVTNGSDNFLRKASIAHLTSSLSGTAPIAISGNAATATNASNTSSISNAVGSSFTWTGVQNFTGNGNTGSSSGIGMSVYSTGGNGAIMAFHRAGVYAVNFGLDSDNVIRIGGWSAAANRLQMDMSGNLTMAGNVTAFSDERKKKNWRPVTENFVEKLADVKVGVYDRVDEEITQVGVSAQSLQEVLPEAVLTDNDGFLSVAYGNAAMTSAVELAKEIVALKNMVKELSAKVDRLQAAQPRHIGN
jgi:hypothetical protein